jgi:hypothetical protein
MCRVFNFHIFNNLPVGLGFHLCGLSNPKNLQHVHDRKQKNRIFSSKQKTYNLPDLESIAGCSQGGYLRIDPSA